MNIEQYDSDKFLGGEGLSLPNRSLLKMDRINTQYKGRIEKKTKQISTAIIFDFTWSSIT